MHTATSKLRTYIWYGINQQGQRLQGEQHAANPKQIKTELRRQGILPIKIRKKHFFIQLAQKISGNDITLFTRQLATLLHAGIPIIQALELCRRGYKKLTMQNLIYTIKIALENGLSIAEALQQHPRYFSALYCNLVHAGEKSGTLDIMFARLATYQEKTTVLKNKIRKMLFYPALVILIAIIITLALLILVVPQFVTLFASFNAVLPLPTRLMIDVANFVQHYGWLVASIFFVLSIGLMKAKQRSVIFNHWLAIYALKLPRIGSILQNAAVARFARTLTTTYAAGLPLVDALQTVAGATGNPIYAKAILRMREDIAQGQPLQFALQQTQLFPAIAEQLIAIGEETGSLEIALAKTAEIFEQNVDHTVETLSSLLEPCIMLILGILIGSLVIAMYLPIFKLGSIV